MIHPSLIGEIIRFVTHGITIANTINRASACYASREKLMASNLPFDAISVGIDEVAIAILKRLHKHRLRVPEDIAIASVDNSETVQFTTPAFTTVDVQKHKTGSRARAGLKDNNLQWQKGLLS